MARDTETPFSETGIWNMADGYTQILTRHATMLDLYQEIAITGVTEAYEIFNTNEEIINNVRIEALKHARIHLQQLISGSIFIIKAKDRAIVIEQAYNDIKSLRKYVDAVVEIKYNQRDHKNIVTVREELFNLCYEKIDLIKQSILPILHRENLIFQYKKELSYKEKKAAIMKRMIERG